jgi:hypothetical protein
MVAGKTRLAAGYGRSHDAKCGETVLLTNV